MAADLLTALFPIVVLLALILYGVLHARDGDLADVTVSGREILIRPRGIFKVLSFRWSIRVPADAIAWASVLDIGGLNPPGMRFVATSFPGLTAGTFSGPDGVSYWLTGRDGAALRLELSEGPLDRIVVQVGSDPASLAARIRNMGRAA
ncbi:hypothetical protein [Streptosporangium pseudovulgare]|uniref:Uncharacterized protein n=1 Tax=Streptosporangium pseudovulgare TaxID=35765 RepID=A0ABQ2QHX6_9ACTN|nr:hypothetical protein [Streptosporangium pseudovulgare]GGP79215.1 hypothetical protein GCM10010140_04580 [Streptosporangium pseudovulgare]